MKVIPYVLAVLFLVGALTVTSMRHALIHQAGERIYVGSVSATREVNNQHELKRFQRRSEVIGPARKKAEQKPDSDGEPVSHRPWHCPTYDSLLDINQLDVRKAGMVDTYVVFTRLLRLLYSHQPWWEAGLDEQIADRLVPHLKKALSHPEALGTLNLGDPHLQQLFYRMLKGAEGTPSLMDYITAEKPGSGAKINVFFAPIELLAAVFDNPDAAIEIVEFRQQLITKMEKPEDQATLGLSPAQRRTQLYEEMTAHLTQYGDARARATMVLEPTFEPKVKYRYAVISGIDPVTRIESKQRLRVDL